MSPRTARSSPRASSVTVRITVTGDTTGHRPDLTGWLRAAVIGPPAPAHRPVPVRRPAAGLHADPDPTAVRRPTVFIHSEPDLAAAPQSA